jgi:transcriptional regulator GlxA family with amidase domain
MLARDQKAGLGNAGGVARAQIVLYDGFSEVDAIGALELLHLAIEHGSPIRPELVRHGSATVTSAYGLRIHVPSLLLLSSLPEILIVPGGGWLRPEDAGAWDEVRRSPLTATIRAMHGAGAVIAGLGSAQMFLSEAGILAGRRVAAERGFEGALGAAGATAVATPIAEDDGVLTATGAMAGAAAALLLIERHLASAVATRVAGLRGLEWSGTAVTPRGPGGEEQGTAR